MDEPVGVCIGFMPPSLSTDQIDVFICEDHNGDNVFIMNKETMIITNDKEIESVFPEPDLLIWRSKKDYKEWAEEMKT